MPINAIRLGRPFSRWRINASECEVDQYGNPIKQGNFVVGWYGVFTIRKLTTGIMPKLAEYAARGRPYPFLISSHQLEDKADVHLPKEKPRKSLKSLDVKFSRRRRRSAKTWVAIVYSPTEYKDMTKT